MSKTAKEVEEKVSDATAEGVNVAKEKAAQVEALTEQAQAEAKAKVEQGTRLYSFYLTTYLHCFVPRGPTHIVCLINCIYL